MNQLTKSFLLATSLFFACALTPLVADAASKDAAIQISPVILEINAKKGETLNIKLKITNITTSDQTYYAKISDFEAQDETGTAKMVLNSTAPDSASIVKWIEPVQPFLLNPNQTKEIITKMVVPNNAEPGGHYGIIGFSTQPNLPTQSGAAATAGAGTLVLVRLDGAATEKLTITDFYAQRKGKKVALFENSPIEFVERFTNSGNVHVKPTGSIVITDMLGRQVGDLTINENKGNVLPNSTRRFEQTLNRKWMFGRYSAKMIATYGTNGGSLNSTLTFWVIPYKLIALAIIAIALVVFLLKRALKRYKKKIVENALKEKQQNTPDKKV